MKKVEKQDTTCTPRVNTSLHFPRHCTGILMGSGVVVKGVDLHDGEKASS